MRRQRPAGFTLIEFVLGALTLTIAIGAIFGAYVGQVTLNEHARNLTLAVQDANRVIERIRQQNVSCGANLPAALPPVGTSWDAWLADTLNPNGGGGKSIGFTLGAEQLIVVTCLRRTPSSPPLATDYCGNDGGAAADQIGTGEWKINPAPTTFDPIQITVTVCWRHRGRTIGECAWNGAALSASDTNADGVIESPAMLTTLVTCRS